MSGHLVNEGVLKHSRSAQTVTGDALEVGEGHTNVASTDYGRETRSRGDEVRRVMTEGAGQEGKK